MQKREDLVEYDVLFLIRVWGVMPMINANDIFTFTNPHLTEKILMAKNITAAINTEEKLFSLVKSCKYSISKFCVNSILFDSWEDSGIKLFGLWA